MEVIDRCQRILDTLVMWSAAQLVQSIYIMDHAGAATDFNKNPLNASMTGTKFHPAAQASASLKHILVAQQRV